MGAATAAPLQQIQSSLRTTWHASEMSVLWNVFTLPFVLVSICALSGSLNIFKYKLDSFEQKYGTFSERTRLEMLEEAKKMFYFGYENYMRYAFPMDELDPIHCRGRGPDRDDPSNININDVLGDYCLSLVDSLDTLAIMGNTTEFKRAVKLVMQTVSFDKDCTVQVFEANIRLLGGLLSAHLLITDSKQPFGNLVPDDYDRELLDLASDLATRLLPAFENTKTGIPFPRVNLRDGVPEGCATHTCTAGAGSLLLEFGVLSRLLGDPVFEGMARRVNRVLWKYRSENTGLFGNVIDIQSGRWIGKLSGLGAGLDSFYEYLLKSYILFGEDEDYKMFNDTYHYIKQYMRRGRPHCNRGAGDHPLYVNVDMHSGATHTTWIDSLQAAFPGVQVLSGDVEEAICAHALYYAIWKLYGALPERFNWQRVTPDVMFYPLRPELVESTYLLYQATRNPFYLHVGQEILIGINNHTKSKCGYATIHNVVDKSLEDRMESFFLSETCKYLYLLFDKDNYANTHASEYIFTTEGHILPLLHAFRKKPWAEEIFLDDEQLTVTLPQQPTPSTVVDASVLPNYISPNHSFTSCEKVDEERQFFLPMKRRYFSQIHAALGLED